MFHRGGSHEAKQEQAVQAAQDPNDSTTSAQAEEALINETKKAGGAAYQFDPDATPEQKAAQARSHVPEGFHHDKKPTAVGLISDKDDGTAPKYDLPTPTKAGAVSSHSRAGSTHSKNPSLNEDSRWARDRTGWGPRFGNGDAEDDSGATLLDHQTSLEGKLDDKWFGDWYYNAGIIIFACLTTHVLSLLGVGLAGVFIVMAFCATYYRTSLRRVRRNFRDDVHREMAKARLENDTESLEWINSFLVKFWPIYAPVLCDTIINSVDQVLSTSTPAFLDSLRMKTFILGTKPPRLEHVKTYVKTEEDTVLMDWKFSFNPNDTADMTSRQLKNKINPKVALEIRIGKGVISKGLDVLVEDFAFSGLMRVKVKLQIPFPHIEKAEICFLGRPEIDYVCKPLGGDTFGFDINFIPGLESFIQEQIHANLAPMMYDPNVFPIEIAKMLSGNTVDQAIGVLQIRLHGGQGLKNPDKFPGIPDPYATVSVNGRDILGKTKTIKESANPQWHETINVVITSFVDSLTIQVFDWNEFRKDKDLGTATFALEALESEPVHEGMQLEVMGGGRARGVVQADIQFFPVLEGVKNADGTSEAVPESNTGIAKFVVEQAKDLDGSKSLIGHLNPYAVLLLNGREIQISQKLKRTNNPIWPNAAKEFLITDRKTAKLGLVLKDDRDLGTDPILATYQIKLDDMLELSSKGQEWYNLAGTKTGRAKMMLQWKPVALKPGAVGSGGYVTPIGVMRFHFQSARDLRNLETMGKSDPYVRVLLSGVQKAQTVTWQNNLNPDFDEIVYVPVHTTREKLCLEVMDQENIGSDRSLGQIDINASEYVVQGEDGDYLVHDEKRQRSDQLRLHGKGSSKGTLNFTCAFYPTLDVADPSDEEQDNETNTDGSAPSRPGDPAANRPSRSNTATSLKLNDTEKEMANQMAAGEQDQGEVSELKTGERPKIKLTADDLSKYESGLIIFKILEADLAQRDCHIEVLMDDMLYPAWHSSKVKSKQMTFNETGDAMVRELDVSRITLRMTEKLDKKGGGNEAHTYAKLTGQTLDVLRQGLYTSIPLTLKGDEGESRINVQLKYLPVRMNLHPSESINNSGTLRVEVHDAADLPAADRNGYSDPYCKFVLNDKQIHKTGVQKKTLHPAWNETFEVAVKSRTAADFRLECFDWDRGGSDDALGNANIDLQVLEPFQKQQVTLGLNGKSGTVRLNMLFKPAYVTRSRQGSSTFQGTFATPGKVIGAPVKGVGKGAVFVGGNVLRGAGFVGRGFRRRKTGDQDPDEFADANDSGAPPVPDKRSVQSSSGSHVLHSYPPSSTPRVVVGDGGSGSATKRDSAYLGTPNDASATNLNGGAHKRTTSFGAASTASGFNNQNDAASMRPDTGTATFSVLSASGFEGDHIRVLVRQHTNKGLKDVHKTKTVKGAKDESGTTAVCRWEEGSETFNVKCTADSQFLILVKDAHTFGSDVDFGEGMLVVADAASQGAGGVEKTYRVGNGTVVVKSGFQHAAGQGGLDGSAAGGPSGLASSAGSIMGGSPGGRRSRFLGRSPRESRQGTPAD